MITVIIAGGSGTRLWPLSTHNYPKHLLRLVDGESLLQGTYRRAKLLSEYIYVVTGADHLEHMRQQLPELGDEAFIVEPDRRDTAGCFVLALHYIQSRHTHDEPIAFLSADHYVRDVDGFVHSFKVAESFSGDRGLITLVGIEPTHPATGYGYIQKDGADLAKEALVYDVLSFKEKPTHEVAQEYLHSGNYLWNAGYFVGSVNAFLAAMDQSAPDLKANYQSLLATVDRESCEQAFLAFNKVSIDYALMEKARHLLVVPASFDWIDLGSFADIHTIVDRDEQENFTKGYVELEAVENSYIRNEEDKPVAVIGLDNVVVVNTPQGILVMRKDQAQKVKTIAQRVQSRQHLRV